MKEFFKSLRFKILLGVCALLVGLMIYAAATGGYSNIVSSVGNAVTTPIFKLSASISGAVSDFFGKFLSAGQISKENEDLRKEIASLRQTQTEYNDLKAENEELKKYIGLKDEHPDFELLSAYVIARDPSEKFYGFTIDKGSANGVKPQSPVITSDGLCGVVTEVGPTHSVVVSILSPAIRSEERR